MTSNRRLRHVLLALAVFGLARLAPAAPRVVDLLAPGVQSWRSPDLSRWSFVDGEIHGVTKTLAGRKTAPESSSFLVSEETFAGDLSVSIDITFDTGRYLGVYLDFGQDTQSGIWMATGHPLPEDPDERHFEVETAYIKTVEESDWTVRTRGELLIEPGERVRLRFVKRGETYSVWHDGRLIVTYYKSGGYPPGPLQLRLTNAKARIHRLEIQAETEAATK